MHHVQPETKLLIAKLNDESNTTHVFVSSILNPYLNHALKAYSL